MDLALVGGWIGSGLGILLAIAGLFREKSRREALNAQRFLEQERQETALQGHVMARVATLEKRMDTQAEHIASLTAQNAEQQRVINDQQHQINVLRRDNHELSEMNADLSARLDASDKRAQALYLELQEAKRTAQPSHLTERPPPVVGRPKGTKL